MEDDFDMAAAVADVGDGLGLGTESGDGDDDLGLGEVATKSEAGEAESGTPPAAETAPAVETPATTPVDDFPKTWRKEASAHWANLPSEVKAEVLKRESDIFQGLETYKVDANFGKSVKTVVAPYEQALRSQNIDPVNVIQGLMHSHHTLATGTQQQKLELFQKIASDYRVDLSGFAPAGEPPYVDPAVQALQNQLQAVQSQLSATERQQTDQRKAEMSKQVDAFASDTKNVYWNEVADDMAALLTKGVVGTLQEAYDKAVWLNPVTRMKEVTRTAAVNAEKAVSEAKAKAEKARAATAANVKTRARTGSAATSADSLDDTLNEALADIRNRA